MKFFRSLLQKSKPLDYEITSNPNSIFNKKCNETNLTLCGHRLGDSVHDLDTNRIDMTGLEVYPKKIDNRAYRDDKHFVIIDGKEIEFTLEERIQAIINSGGWLGYPDGSRFGIKDKRIVNFSLHGERLLDYKNMTKKGLQERLGKRTRTKENYEQIDGSLFNSDLIDLKRKVSIVWDDWDYKISVILIGDIVVNK